MSRHGGTAFAIEGGRPFTGRVEVPGDKSISHRAVILGALADGVSVVRGRSDGEDVRHTEEAARCMGAHVEGEHIYGGKRTLRPPDTALYLGNSGTSMRLLAGVVASRPWTVELRGDSSLSTRPMDRVAVPLRLMGAGVEGRTERCLPPLVVRGGSLHGIDYSPPVPSAQVKSCVLLAGLEAQGETVVRERVLTRQHTEELFSICGAQISESNEDGDHVVRILPGEPEAFELDVPADPSQAAFWVVGACLLPGSEVTVARLYVGAARRGFLDVLKRMGARLEEVPTTRPDDLAATADVVVRSGPLVATQVDAAEIPGLDEVPVLAVAAARAEGTTVFRGMGELRVKESDRLEAVAEMVRAFGAGAEVDGEDLLVTGARALSAAHVDARGDHRIAMAAAIAAASVSEGTTCIMGWETVDSSYPAFAEHMAQLTGGRA
jgi:3-phosphoshikimate 1-carboxyvinyltransferase